MMKTSVKPAEGDSVGTLVEVGPPGQTRFIGRYHLELPEPRCSEVLFGGVDGGPVLATRRLVGAEEVLGFGTCGDVDRLMRRLSQLGQPSALRLTAAAPATRGRCRVCGCTMECACPSGCWWADESETLCRQHGGDGT